MTIQLRIVHTTGYRCTEASAASYNEARVTPATTTDQLVIRSRVEITPTAWSMEYRDYWGSTVTAFEIHDPYAELTLVATSTVEVAESTPTGDSIEWSDLADVQDRWCEYVDSLDSCDPTDDLAAELQNLRQQAQRPAEFVDLVIQHVTGRVPVSIGHVTAHDSAAQAWVAGTASTRDIAHIVAGALRWADIPTRYVSGYLHPEAEPAVGETVMGIPHAWVEWWDGDWRSLDPSGEQGVGRGHVVVARGRSYDDNPPMRGIHASDGDIEPFHSIQITRTR